MVVSTSLVKTVFLLGSVASLFGGIAIPVTVKADGSLNVSVQAKATVKVGAKGRAKAKSKAKTTAVSKSKKAAKKTTEANKVKGQKAMKNSINIGVVKSVWRVASSSLGV